MSSLRSPDDARGGRSGRGSSWSRRPPVARPPRRPRASPGRAAGCGSRRRSPPGGSARAARRPPAGPRSPQRRPPGPASRPSTAAADRDRCRACARPSRGWRRCSRPARRPSQARPTHSRHAARDWPTCRNRGSSSGTRRCGWQSCAGPCRPTYPSARRPAKAGARHRVWWPAPGIRLTRQIMFDTDVMLQA